MHYVNNTWWARSVLVSHSCLMSPVSTTVCNESNFTVRGPQDLFTITMSPQVLKKTLKNDKEKIERYLH